VYTPPPEAGTHSTVPEQPPTALGQDVVGEVVTAYSVMVAPLSYSGAAEDERAMRVSGGAAVIVTQCGCDAATRECAGSGLVFTASSSQLLFTASSSTRQEGGNA
jgi:hypothetical protein